MLHKGKAMSCVILVCLFFAPACRKDRPQLDPLQIENAAVGQLIKQDVIEKWLEENPASKYLSLDWSKARQAVIQGKNVVRVPTLNINKTIPVLQTTNLKTRLQASNGKIANTSTAAGNTNFYDNHPPEVFFIANNGSTNLKSYLLNFIPTDKTKEFGENGIWTGQLLEWNLTGDTIFIQNIVKSVLKEKYAAKQGSLPKPKTSGVSLKDKVLLSASPLKDKSTYGLFKWLGDLLGDFIGWIGSAFGLSTHYVTTSDGEWRDHWRLDAIDLNLVSIFGDGNGGGGSGGGSGYSGNYTYAGNPIYSGYMDGYGSNNANGASNYDPYAPYPHSGGNGGGSGPSYNPNLINNEAQLRQKGLLINSLAIKTVEAELMIEQHLTNEQLSEVSRIIYEQLSSSEYSGNELEIDDIDNILSNDEDPPFWERVKALFRLYMRIDQPRNLLEIQLVDEIDHKVSYLSAEIKKIHEVNQKIFFFVPGYSALDALIAEKNLSSAAVNLSVDLFGGSILKGITGPVFKLAEKYSFKTVELAITYPNIAGKLKLFSISEFTIVKRSSTDKIIIIGEKMEERVLPSKDLFNKFFQNVETFKASPAADYQIQSMKSFLGRNLTEEELITTAVYSENKAWITKKLSEGYNVIDIGSKIENQVRSVFYGMERSLVYVK